MLDLISLAAKNPLVKAFLCVYLCVYVRTRMLLWVFPPCLSNRKLMWSSTEDREKAFSFHCESFEREKKKWKKKREEKKKRPGLCTDSTLCNLACFSLFLFFPPSPSLHSLYLMFYFSFFSHSFVLFLVL